MNNQTTEQSMFTALILELEGVIRSAHGMIQIANSRLQLANTKHSPAIPNTETETVADTSAPKVVTKDVKPLEYKAGVINAKNKKETKEITVDDLSELTKILLKKHKDKETVEAFKEAGVTKISLCPAHKINDLYAALKKIK